MRLVGYVVNFMGLLAVWVNTHADPLFFDNVMAGTAGHEVSLFENPGALVDAIPAPLEGRPEKWLYLSVSMGFDKVSPGTPGITDKVRLSFDRDVIDSPTPNSSPPVRFIEFDLPEFSVGNNVGLAFPSVYVSPASGYPLPIMMTIDILNSAPDYIIPAGPQAGTLVDSYTYSFRIQHIP